jgi:nucleoside-diphosphate-sugar epimerase
MDIFHNKDVYITGFSGYIGSHLVDIFLQNNIRPICIARSQAKRSEYRVDVEVITWNSLDELSDQVRNSIEPIVFNLAGYFAGQHKSSDISKLINSNLQFPISLFEAFKNCRATSIVNVGTSWELSRQPKALPLNLYACLKASNAQALKWYCQAYDMTAINLKLNDTYGGNDTRNKLLSYLKKALKETRPVNLGTASQVVNILHISDVVSGLIASAKQACELTPGFCKDYALLHPDNTTIGAIIECIQSEIQKDFDVSFSHIGEGDNRSLTDNTTILPEWRAEMSLKSGLVGYLRDVHGY